MSTVTITLQKIRDNSPGETLWEQVLRAHEHLGLNTEFPLVSVLDSNKNVLDTVWCLPEYENLWRKFAVWCAAQVELLLTDERSKTALRVAWKYSDGLATDEARIDARVAAYAAAEAAYAAAKAARDAAAYAASDAAYAAVAAIGAAAYGAADAAIDAASDDERDAARDAQRKKLTEILTAGTWVDVEFARLMEGK